MVTKKNQKLVAIFVFLAFFLGISFNSNSIIEKCIDGNNESGFTQNFSKVFSYEGSSEEIGSNFGITFREEILEQIIECKDRIEKIGYSEEYVKNFVEKKEIGLKENSPHILTEYKAMAEVSGVSYYDILVLNLFNPREMRDNPNDTDECTTWIATGTSTLNNESLLHKNRDLSQSSQAVFKVSTPGKYSYIALGNLESMGTSAGFNEYGVAICNNVGFVFEVNPFGLDAFVITRKVLEECKTVEEAYDMINSLPRFDGNIFFVVDKDKGAIIEVTPSAISSFEDSVVENNVDYRSNSFLVLPHDTSLDRERRFGAAKQYLDEKNGSITVMDCNELSRHHFVYEDGNSPVNDYSICSSPESGGGRTLFGATFQINRTYPKELSTLWAAPGLPETTIYTPIHLLSSDIYDVYENGSAWDISEKIRKGKIGPFNNLVPEFLEFESQIIANAKVAESLALIEIEAGNITGARTILTNFDISNGTAVYEKMIEISEEKFWKDSFTDNSGVSDLINITINKDSNSKNITLQEKLNSSHIDILGAYNAYECVVDKFPFLGDENNRNDFLKLSSTNFQKINVSDNLRYEITNNENAEKAMLWLEMEINEPLTNIDQLNFTFEGYSNDGDELEIFILQNEKDWSDRNAWYRLGSWSNLGETDEIYSCLLNSQFDKFINSSNIITWVVGDPFSGGTSLSIDNVKLDIIKKTAHTQKFETNGTILSEIISLDNVSCWDSAIFKVSQDIPDNTTILYKILDAETNAILLEINSTSAGIGIRLAALDKTSIIISAELSTVNESKTPVIFDWNISGILYTYEEPTSTLGIVDLIIIITATIFLSLFLILSCSVFIIRRKWLKNFRKTRSETVEEEQEEEKNKKEEDIVEYTGFFALLIAWLVDNVLVFLMMFISLSGIYMVSTALNVPFNFINALIHILLSWVIVKILYFSILERFGGQTVGKYLCYIKTVDENSKKSPNLKNSIIKAILTPILDIIIGKTGKSKLELDDKSHYQRFSKTLIIKVQNRTIKWIMLLIPLITYLLAFLIAYLVIIKII
ncbi:MAG: hypothetical protein GY870_16340 [archaeon]|nr:hypothetical protein [archaeon]